MFNGDKPQAPSNYNDGGSAARYFYCAKANKRDRNEGLNKKRLNNIELFLYNNIGNELWKDKLIINEGYKAKHLEDMVVSLKKAIEEYGIQAKKDIDLSMLLYGKKNLEKYLSENKIHHKDGNKLNNDISNLELVEPLYHKRTHSECELRDGEWWKPCRNCGELKPIGDYYKRKDGISPWCKQCCIKNAVANKRKRKLQHSLLR